MKRKKKEWGNEDLFPEVEEMKELFVGMLDGDKFLLNDRGIRKIAVKGIWKCVATSRGSRRMF
jgi:hypothetical protein